MRWVKSSTYYVSGPWLIRRYGYGFMLTRNGKQISYHKSITAAKAAAQLNSQESSKE